MEDANSIIKQRVRGFGKEIEHARTDALGRGEDLKKEIECHGAKSLGG